MEEWNGLTYSRTGWRAVNSSRRDWQKLYALMWNGDVARRCDTYADGHRLSVSCNPRTKEVPRERPVTGPHEPHDGTRSARGNAGPNAGFTLMSSECTRRLTRETPAPGVSLEEHGDGYRPRMD